MTFWRWVLKDFKGPRKPTAEKSTSENLRGKRPIFLNETKRNGFYKDCNFTREFSISRHEI